jgi:hypothetical protein
MSEVTYGQLDRALHSLGFSVRAVEPENREYRHGKTGALVFLPVFPDDEPVLPRHLVAVRAVLQAYGLADPLDFPANTLQAG